MQRVIAYTFNDDGDLERVLDGATHNDFVYDGMGRVAYSTIEVVGISLPFRFQSTYNAASRRTVLQADLDSELDFKNEYSYDNLHRLTSLTQRSPTIGSDVAPKRIEFGYNELGQFTRIDRYAATTATEFVAASYYFYDDMNRLTKLVHSESTTAPSSGWGSDPLAGYQFSYDAGSRFTTINSYLDGVTDYAHNDTNQLVGADHATATDEAYEYDSNGNRTMAGYDVDPNNQLASDGTYNYTYDDEGNRLTRTKISDGYVTRYDWDFRNRLVKVTEEDDSSNVLQFTENYYDGFNQWIRRSFDADGPGGTSAVDTFFIYESGQIVLELDGTSYWEVSHRYLWSEQVDHLLADEATPDIWTAGTVTWPLGDHLNTFRDLVSYDSGTDDATIDNHREFDSYGSLTDESDPGVDSLFGFTGRPFDETTGLQNNLNRWLDPAVGRWMSEDPIGFADDLGNLARYVSNRVLSGTDPSGLEFGVIPNNPYGKWSYSLVPHKDTDPFPTKPPVYSVSGIIFFAPKPANTSSEFAFIQLSRLTLPDGTIKTSGQEQYRLTKDGWSVDRLDGMASGWYGQLNNDKFGDTVKLGGGGKIGYLWDTPSGASELKWEFQTYAVGHGKDDLGVAYSGVSWGFTADKSQNITLDKSKLITPGKTLMDSVGAWNDQANLPPSKTNTLSDLPQDLFPPIIIAPKANVIDAEPLKKK